MELDQMIREAKARTALRAKELDAHHYSTADFDEAANSVERLEK
jgi:hypothetical protein